MNAQQGLRANSLSAAPTVGAQAYTWDNNSNLLADGVLTYTYDSANRPITFMQGAITNYN